MNEVEFITHDVIEPKARCAKRYMLFDDVALRAVSDAARRPQSLLLTR